MKMMIIDTRCRGFAGLYMIAILIVVTALVSFAVDYGRVQLASAQLLYAAEGAARSAGASLAGGDVAARSAAIECAALNRCDGTPVALSDGDIEFGTWDETEQAFSPVGSASSANAVRVTARRTSTSGGQIPLLFASVLGAIGCNAQGLAVVKVDRTNLQGLIGLDEVRFSSLGVLSQIQGDIASNGNIYVGVPLGLLVSVDGDARSYRGTTFKGTLAGITGSKSALSDELVCPSVSLPIENNNGQISSYLNAAGDFNALVSATIPSGTYVVRDLNLVAGLNVNLQGPVTFYVTRDVNIAIGVNLFGNSSFAPSHFKVRVASGGCVNFLANLLTPVCMDLYAPDSDINVAVTVTSFRGRLVGKTVLIAVPALSRFNMQDTPTDGPKLTLVK